MLSVLIKELASLEFLDYAQGDSSLQVDILYTWVGSVLKVDHWAGDSLS